MIVPMNKVFLVILEAEKREALKKLRQLGLVHLETLQGQSAELSSLKTDLEKIKLTRMRLSELKMPKETKAGKAIELENPVEFSDAITELFKESIRIDDEIRKIKGLPVARYDDETEKAYLEYPDGRIEYVE